MKICLIGSTRFAKLYREANLALTLSGHCVYTCASFKDDGHANTDDEKEILDLVHLRKILESEIVVLITDETGYFGTSTRREIRWISVLSGERAPVLRLWIDGKMSFSWPHDLEEKIRSIWPKSRV